MSTNADKFRSGVQCFGFIRGDDKELLPKTKVAAFCGRSIWFGFLFNFPRQCIRSVTTLQRPQIFAQRCLVVITICETFFMDRISRFEICCESDVSFLL